tara:strand:+ start:109 stop:321 length:213 start_codon:yes stop_codon:yes gene_type:complete
MKNTDQIKALAVSIEEKDNQIRMLMAQQGNHEVQIAEYRQIVKELSDKLKLYESKYGTVFKSSRNISTQK